MDRLKETVATAALDAAVAGIIARIGGTYTVEPVPHSTLERTVRVREKGDSGGPRYFTVKVSEPI